jgi:Ser/Thr protein kinase RdoA (MazF antagonist)
MRLDTSGIDQEQLARFVDDAYALEIAAMSFLPKGEASHSYIGVERSGPRWVIKVQETARMVNLEARLRAVRFVHVARGFTQVVAPRQNRWGDCTCLYELYTVTVYPFVEGETIEPGRQTDAYVTGLASLLGAFHAHGSMLPLPIPRATFDNPSEEPILHALRTVEAPGQLANPIQERLRDLMLSERSNIVTTLEKMRQITDEVRGLDLDWVLIHGDPNWENILVDRSGIFHLLDWEDLALGPPEADLVFFSDRPPQRFEAFLRQYLVTHGSARLHPGVFEYCWYRWNTHEIAEYTTRILFRNVDPAEAEHAWAELQPYVPTSHADIAAGIRQIAEILARITG